MFKSRKSTQYFGSYRETEKKREDKWENAIFQRSLLPTRFMLELQKLLIKYSNKGVRLLLGSFPFFITCSSLHGNYGWRLGASSVRDTSSIRCITVIQFYTEKTLLILIEALKWYYSLEPKMLLLFWVWNVWPVIFLGSNFEACYFFLGRPKITSNEHPCPNLCRV